MNEIHRPEVIGMGRLRPVGSQLRLDPMLGNLVVEPQVHLRVKAIDSRRVDRPVVTLDQDTHTPIAVAHPCLADVFDLQLQFGLLAAPEHTDSGTFGFGKSPLSASFHFVAGRLLPAS